jgi:hypothetical protein
MARGLKPGQRHSGQFQKGSCPNPGGRPKAIFALATECQKYGAEAVEFVVSVMRDPNAKLFQRMQAAAEILDRGFGRPKVSTEVTGLEGGPMEMIVRVITKQADGN